MNKILTTLMSMFTMKSTMKKTLSAVLFVSISAVGIYWYTSAPATLNTSANTSVIELSRSMGSADAPIVLEEFSSLTCPHCATFHKSVYPDLIKKYVETGKVRIEFKSFPLDNLALAANLLALSLPKENFFQFINHALFYQDALFKAPKETLLEWSRRVGISQKDFEAIISDKDSANAVQKNIILYQKKYNIKGTPTVVINGVVVDKVEKETVFKAIEKALENL